jgi:hypothetical protein
MSIRYLPFQEWLASLPPDTQRHARELVEQFRALGAEDPESWARSQISENIPQLARFLVLDRVRRECFEKWYARDALNSAARYDNDFEDLLGQLREHGVRDDTIAALAHAVARQTAMDVVYIIDEGHDPNAPRHTPSWSLQETDAKGEPMDGASAACTKASVSLMSGGGENRSETFNCCSSGRAAQHRV